MLQTSYVVSPSRPQVKLHLTISDTTSKDIFNLVLTFFGDLHFLLLFGRIDTMLFMWDKTTIDKIRKGYYSAVYFNSTKEILLREKNLSIATMQIFQKKDNVTICGIKHVIEILKIGTGYF